MATTKSDFARFGARTYLRDRCAGKEVEVRIAAFRAVETKDIEAYLTVVPIVQFKHREQPTKENRETVEVAFSLL